jgi:hypothetical protein
LIMDTEAAIEEATGAGHRSLSLSKRPDDLIQRASRVQQSFNIGDRRIWPNAYLAPMSGVTDTCFRRLVSRLAGGRTGLLVSEFVSVQVLTQPGGKDNAKSAREMGFAEEERPFSIQIFGADADKMGAGARIAADTGCDFIEINCGCPAPKVVGKGGGSGLLKDLPNLASILRTVKASVDIPVTIKVRVGWNDDLITLFETLKIADSEGAAAFVIHGRTRAQGYKGLATGDLSAEAKRRAPGGRAAPPGDLRGGRGGRGPRGDAQSVDLRPGGGLVRRQDAAGTRQGGLPQRVLHLRKPFARRDGHRASCFGKAEADGGAHPEGAPWRFPGAVVPPALAGRGGIPRAPACVLRGHAVAGARLRGAGGAERRGDDRSREREHVPELIHCVCEFAILNRYYDPRSSH